MTTIRVVDFETSDLPPPNDAGRVCEIGVCDLVGVEDGTWHVNQPTSVLVNPGHHIRPEAMAVHHIMDEDVIEAPSFSEAADIILSGKPDILAAHKADFERSFFTTPATWICSYKCALVMAPNAPGWSNQVLRYWLKLDVDRTLAEPAHRAGPDAYVTAHLLARMLAKLPLASAIEISSRPAMLPRFTFGKHAMKPIDEIETGYLDWVSKQTDMDPDVLYTARAHLEKRRAAQRMRSPV